MSAARDMIKAFMNLDYPSGQKDADAVIDDFAHELAESLRDSIGRADYPGETEHVMRFVRGFRAAADTIDPKKGEAP